MTADESWILSEEAASPDRRRKVEGVSGLKPALWGHFPRFHVSLAPPETPVGFIVGGQEALRRSNGGVVGPTCNAN